MTVEWYERLRREADLEGVHLTAKTEEEIVTACMMCGVVYRVIPAEGAEGGLSTGLCLDHLLDRMYGDEDAA